MQKIIRIVTLLLAFAAPPAFSQTSADNPRLKKALERYPEADGDKDGVLTMSEAKAFRKKISKPKASAKEPSGEEATDSDVLESLVKVYEAREFKGVKYRLLKPLDLAKNPDQKYPVILSLHGAGGIGNDNVRNLREWCSVMAQDDWRLKYPCFVVVPQTFGFWRTPAMTENYSDENIAKMSGDWKEIVSGHRKRLQDPEGANLDRVFLLLDEMAKEFPIDTDRVYVMGHSGGGFGTWTALADQPDRFAAAITSAGWLAPWFDENVLKDMPIWSFQGAKDKTSQVNLGNATFERMKKIEANMKFTEVASLGHGVSGAAFRYTGDNPTQGGMTKYASEKCDKTADVWDWLFSKKRGAEEVTSTKAAEAPSSTKVPGSGKAKKNEQENKKNGVRLQPTHADVSYGDHVRHKFHVWLPEGKSGAVPVFVFFHGGGFVGGKKTDFDPRPYLNAGFAAVSASYRLLDGVNTLGPVPMQDGARAIQAIRMNAAEWDIDPERIAVSGVSAGAVIAMWIGYHDDLAHPDSDDPISRQSTRVKCIVPTNGPTNLDPTWVRANLGGPQEIHPSLPKMYGVTEGFDKPEISARISTCNPWAMVSADDPPTLMIYSRDTEPMPLAATVGTSYLIHHPQFGVELKKKLDATKVANELHTGIERQQGTTLIVNWLKTQFK